MSSGGPDQHRVYFYCDTVTNPPGVCSYAHVQVVKIQEDKEAGRGEKRSLPPEGPQTVKSSNYKTLCNMTSSLMSSVGEGSSETEPSPERSANVHSEPVTVEFSVELKKWRSVAEARHLSP